MAVIIVYTILNWLTPLDGDDFNYRFIFKNGQSFNNPEVKNLSDLVISQIDHFLHENSRTLVHSIAQALLMVNGKWLFNIINPFFFLAYILLIVRYATGKIDLHPTVFAFFLITVMPGFGNYYLWMMGCLNYLWTSVFVLIFLLLLEKRKENEISKRSWGVLLFAFFAGWTHEGITIPIAIGFILSALPKWRELKKTEYAWMLLCFLSGAILCLSFTIHKAFSDSSDGIMQMLSKKIGNGNSIMGDLRLIYVLAVGCLFGLLCYSNRLSSFFRENVRWFLVLLVGIGIVYATGLYRIRIAYVVEFCSLILLVRLYKVFKPNIIIKRLLSTILIILMIAFYSIVMYWSVRVYEQAQNYDQQMKEGNTTVIVDYLNVPSLIDGYIMGFSYAPSYNISFLNPDYSVNIIIANFYHLPSVAFYPLKLLEDMAYHPEIFNEFTDCGYLPYYVRRKTCKEEIDQVLYKLRPVKDEEKPWWVQITGIQRQKDKEFYLDEKYTCVIVGEDEWICVKKNEIYDDRVESILIKTKVNGKDFKDKIIISHEDKSK